MIEVTRERKLQFHLAQMKDVIEMQAIYEAVASGTEAREACGAVIGGKFNLTPLVRQGVGENVNVSH
jgi:hypothetical protein